MGELALDASLMFCLCCVILAAKWLSTVFSSALISCFVVMLAVFVLFRCSLSSRFFIKNSGVSSDVTFGGSLAAPSRFGGGDFFVGGGGGGGGGGAAAFSGAGGGAAEADSFSAGGSARAPLDICLFMLAVEVTEGALL